MRYIFEARPHSPKLLPDNIKGDAQCYSRSYPRRGYSRRTAAQRILTFGNGEKIRLLKQKKHSYLAPPGGCENLPKDKGGKGESVGKPTLSTGCYACPMFRHSIDGSCYSPVRVTVD